MVVKIVVNNDYCGNAQNITLEQLKKWSNECDMFVKEIDTGGEERLISMCNGKQMKDRVQFSDDIGRCCG